MMEKQTLVLLKTGILCRGTLSSAQYFKLSDITVCTYVENSYV